MQTRGLHRRHEGRNRFRGGGVRVTNPTAHTREVRTVLLKKAAGKRSWSFLTGTPTQATIRWGETSSLRSELFSSLLIAQFSNEFGKCVIKSIFSTKLFASCLVGTS